MTEPHMETVTDFLGWLDTNYPELGKLLERLDADGQARLAGVLRRFDTDRSGRLGSAEKTRAREVLRLLRDPSTASLESLDQILAYLDVNAVTRLDPRETEMCIQILGLAGRTAHDDGRVSASELWGLLKEMRALDGNNDGRLDVRERAALVGKLRGATR